MADVHTPRTADVETTVAIETKCGLLMENMFHQTHGPGGDTWETDIVEKTVDFVKFDKPVKICSCILQEKRDESLRDVPTDFKKRQQCGCLNVRDNKSYASHCRYVRQLLDTLRPSQTWRSSTGVWRKQVSSEPIKRKEVLLINQLLDCHLEKKLAQERGICPERRHLFNSLFDEMIRQEIIISPERGLLLTRVRDELKMSMTSYEALYLQGLNYGMNKRLTGELLIGAQEEELDNMSNETSAIRGEVQSIKDDLQRRDDEMSLGLTALQARRQTDFEHMQEINEALQAQLAEIIPEIEQIERERRMKQL